MPVARPRHAAPSAPNTAAPAAPGHVRARGTHPEHPGAGRGGQNVTLRPAARGGAVHSGGGGWGGSVRTPARPASPPRAQPRHHQCTPRPSDARAHPGAPRGPRSSARDALASVAPHRATTTTPQRKTKNLASRNGPKRTCAKAQPARGGAARGGSAADAVKTRDFPGEARQAAPDPVGGSLREPTNLSGLSTKLKVMSSCPVDCRGRTASRRVGLPHAAARCVPSRPRDPRGVLAIAWPARVHNFFFFHI